MPASPSLVSAPIQGHKIPVWEQNFLLWLRRHEPMLAPMPWDLPAG
jgi:hypothetical protein